MATNDRTADLESELLKGARGVQNKTENMLERLAGMFTATDLVTIKNVMPEEFGWVYTDPRETEIQQPNSSTRRINFGDPKVHKLQPGQTKTVPGWEAYIALNRMWKAWAQQDISQVAYVLQSSDEMTKFLSEAYQGTFDPDSMDTNRKPDLGFEQPATQDRAAAAEQQLQQTVAAPTADPNLGFDDEDEDSEEPVNSVPPMSDATTPPTTEQNQ